MCGTHSPSQTAPDVASSAILSTSSHGVANHLPMRGGTLAIFREGVAVYVLCMRVGLGVSASTPYPSTEPGTRTPTRFILRLFSGRGYSQTHAIYSQDPTHASKQSDHASL